MLVSVILVMLMYSNTIMCDMIKHDWQSKYLDEIKSEVKICENITSASTTINQGRTKDIHFEGKGMKKKENMFTKMLPFMVIPFLISSMMTPMVLTSLKFMLLKAAFFGKMAIILFLINAFWRFNNQGGVYSHNVNLSHDEKEIAMAHYGYNGDEEYGAYVHR